MHVMIFFYIRRRKKKQSRLSREQVLDVEDASGNSVKSLLAGVKIFEGVFKGDNSNKNVIANV